MGGKLTGRIRWRNVARAAAVAGVAALVVAWPRLTPPPPRIAGGEAVPVEAPPAVAPATDGHERAGAAAGPRAARATPTPRRRRRPGPRRRGPADGHCRMPARGATRTVAPRSAPARPPTVGPRTPVAPRTPAAPRTPVPAPPVADPAVLEFGPEG